MMRSDYRRILWYEFCGDQLVVGITSETPLHFILLYNGLSVGQFARYAHGLTFDVTREVTLISILTEGLS